MSILSAFFANLMSILCQNAIAKSIPIFLAWDIPNLLFVILLQPLIYQPSLHLSTLSVSVIVFYLEKVCRHERFKDQSGVDIFAYVPI